MPCDFFCISIPSYNLALLFQLPPARNSDQPLARLPPSPLRCMPSLFHDQSSVFSALIDSRLIGSIVQHNPGGLDYVTMATTYKGMLSLHRT